MRFWRHFSRTAIVSSGRLNFTGPEAILKRPELLIRAFEESARLDAPLTGEAKRLIQEFLYLVGPAYRSAPEIVRAFERTLLAPEATTGLLDDMLATGFLGALIPEFQAISNRIQYEPTRTSTRCPATARCPRSPTG